MKKIGLFYGVSTAKTAAIAKNIQDAFGATKVDLIPVEKAWKPDVEAYDLIIVGAATWFDGELPTYWDEFIPALETLHLDGKKVAVFGLGNQKEYPDNFVDGIGILAKVFQSIGCELIGKTSAKGYTFNHSLALEGDEFLGLVIDFETQGDQTAERIKCWVEDLKKHL